MELESHWHILPNDMVVVVLAHLSGKEIARAATVNKQFYVCTSDNSLWKRKFMQDYDHRITQKMAGRPTGAEEAFLELLQPEHPEHYVLTDWKNGYVMKVIGNVPHERLQCFSNCLSAIRDGFPMLNGHDLPLYMLMPRLIEPILPLKIDRIFSRREVRDRLQKPIEEYKNEQGTQLFKKIVAESTPEQLNLKYLLVNGAKHPEIMGKLLKSNAPSISLLAKWFNSTNSSNFPFIVKFDGDLELTEWLFTHGYERSAVVLMSITPTISEHVAKQWYLQSYDSTTALLIYLKNHIARWFKCIDQKSFCWIYDAVTVYSVCRAFEAKQVDKLFYTVTENGQGEATTREPVVDSYLVFGNEFFIGELPHETVLLQRDQYLSESANMSSDTAEFRLKAMMYYKQYREAYFHGAERFGAKLKAMATHEERHAHQNHVHQALLKYGATGYVNEFYQLVGDFGEFWEVEECKALLQNAAFTKAVLDQLQVILVTRAN